jgi:trimeric autotransporter adhesin
VSIYEREVHEMNTGKDSKSFAGVSMALLIPVIVAVFSVHGCKVKLNNTFHLATISIIPENASIAGGSIIQLIATGVYSDSTTTTMTSSVVWSSSDPIVTISATGLATVGAVTSSTPCIITAVEPGGLTGSTVLTVRNLPLVSITVTPSDPPTINQGTFTQFTATGMFSDGSDSFTQDLSSSVTWTSTNSLVADIDASGKATGKTAGTTFVAAAWSGVTSNSVTLTVTGMELQSINLEPLNDTVYHMKTSYFTAWAIFSDGVTTSDPQDVTTSVVWTSSDPSIATIGQYRTGEGMAVIGKDFGTVTITATMGLVSASTTLEVVVAGVY